MNLIQQQTQKKNLHKEYRPRKKSFSIHFIDLKQFMHVTTIFFVFLQQNI